MLVVTVVNSGVGIGMEVAVVDEIGGGQGAIVIVTECGGGEFWLLSLVGEGGGELPLGGLSDSVASSSVHSGSGWPSEGTYSGSLVDGEGDFNLQACFLVLRFFGAVGSACSDLHCLGVETLED